VLTLEAPAPVFYEFYRIEPAATQAPH
jgi:hypothetical protein